MKLKIGNNTGSLRIPNMQDILNIFSDRYAGLHISLLGLDWLIIVSVISIIAIIGKDEELFTIGAYLMMATIPLYVMAKLVMFVVLRPGTVTQDKRLLSLRRKYRWFVEKLNPNDSMANTQSFMFKTAYAAIAIITGIVLFVPEEWKFMVPVAGILLICVLLISISAAVIKLMSLMDEWDVI